MITKTDGTGTIVIVEDSDEDYETAVEALGRAGMTCEIRRARTGDDCLALLRGISGGAPVRPAFVLLDLNTPGCDGREALREIKDDPALRAVPVVVLTTSSSPRDLETCYSAGANAYHVKPVQYPDHLGVLQHIYGYWLRCVALPVGQEPIA